MLLHIFLRRLICAHRQDPLPIGTNQTVGAADDVLRVVDMFAKIRQVTCALQGALLHLGPVGCRRPGAIRIPPLRRPYSTFFSCHKR